MLRNSSLAALIFFSVSAATFNFLLDLIATIFTEGGRGSAAWRGHADVMMGFLRDATIDSGGDLITTTADAFVRFSPPEIPSQNRHPYVSAAFAEAPFHVTNITAPFVRYSLG